MKKCTTKFLYGVSVADIIKQTVNDCICEKLLPGYVFLDKYQLYYNAQTGYYYDANTSLFYHAETRCYYYYDEQSSSYVFHSRPLADHVWSTKTAKRHAQIIFGELYMKGMSQDEVDVFECICEIIETLCKSTDLSNGVSCDEILLNEFENEIESMIEEERIRYAACIRLIEVSNASKLHIVTMNGANIGNLHDCDVTISSSVDEKSEVFARIDYLDENSQYVITAMSEYNPLMVNGEYISKGSNVVVNHFDEWKIGNNVLVAHIHYGSNTCTSCEPGLLAVSNKPNAKNFVNKKVSLEVSRRRTMKQLKAEYGLLDMDYIVSPSVKSNLRESNGSNVNVKTSIYKHCQAKPLPEKLHFLLSQKTPSVEAPIDKSNKGYKLLQTMGWNSGEGLGRYRQGGTEPIINIKRTGRAGLGSLEKDKRTEPSKKIKIAKITKERFDAIVD
ncbi:unnamed protein product [Dracunculus medinensis]|uniref:G-patch domain-containing protein n=1 Tax=Dracunculus medinensis TaxID=318479 RepID=A0A0N4U1D7_DRAME|nr:unnamed protein product [Dracunculus medinensis]